MSQVQIARLHTLPAQAIKPLIEESQKEGFRFVKRLAEDYAAGINRFDGRGEALFGAFANGTLCGVAGLSMDPYLQDQHTGRVRHVYVLSSHRKRGIARQLMEKVLTASQASFTKVTLWTDSKAAAALYEQLGFFPIAVIPKATHCKVHC